MFIIFVLYFQLEEDYLQDETYWMTRGVPTRISIEMNTAAAHLVLNLIPGMEMSAFFQAGSGLITQLFNWAEKGPEPLQSYATGLLAAAMLLLENLKDKFKKSNENLTCLMLKKLFEIITIITEEKSEDVVKIEKSSNHSSDQSASNAAVCFPKSTRAGKACNATGKTFI